MKRIGKRHARTFARPGRLTVRRDGRMGRSWLRDAGLCAGSVGSGKRIIRAPVHHERGLARGRRIVEAETGLLHDLLGMGMSE